MWRIIAVIFLTICSCSVNICAAAAGISGHAPDAKHDTLRIADLIAMGENVYLAKPDSAVLYWKAAEQIIAKNFSTLSSNNPLVLVYKKHLGALLNNMGQVAQIQGKYADALNNFNKCLKIMEEIGDQENIALSLNNIGYIYNKQGNMAKAIEYYEKSLQLYERTGDKKGISLSLNNLGRFYDNQGDIAKALDYYHKSLKLREEIGDKVGIGYSLNNIGYIYDNQGDFPKALDYYQKSLQIRIEIDDRSGMGECLNNIGSLYYNQGNITKAFDYHTKSLKAYEEIGDKEGIAFSYRNIGTILYNQGDVKGTLEAYNKALKLQKEMGDKYGVAATLNFIGTIYYNIKDYQKALNYCTESMKLSKDLGYPESIKSAANLLSSIYEKTGNHKLAFENYRLYVQMRDSVNNIETQKAAIKQQTKYEYDKQKAIIKKEHELQLTQKEDQAAADRQQQRIIIASISIILLLVMVFSGFLFNRFKLTQRQKNIIEAKEKETLLQKHIIEEKHKEITDSINYAERIQYSFLATKDFLDKHLQNYFVYFNPKDVVSGDFYWAGTLSNGNVALVTADSTGHGVPGAIMSLLNITSLENAIKETPEPGEILNITRQTIIDRLKKDGSAEGGKDGMDCSLIAFDFRNKKLVYAAANNPVWIVRNSEFIALPADRMPVGKHDKDAVPFTQHEVELKTGDVIYALTDGFPDQFGGPKGKKFKYKQLEELFLKIAQKPMKEQKEELDSVFQNWRGNLEQVDDVCIIGVRV